MTDNGWDQRCNIKILGAVWLVLGGLTFALVLTSLFPLVQGNTPSPIEAGDEWWIVVLVFAVVLSDIKFDLNAY